jgi:hypothetical protein
MHLFLILAAVVLLSAIVILGCAMLANRKRPEVRNMINNQPGAGESLNGIKTFTCSTVADFTTFATTYTNAVQPPGRFALVKLDSAVAGGIRISAASTDKCIGVALDVPDVAGDPVAVKLLSVAGTLRMVASGAITAGDSLTSNGDGACKTWVTGSSQYVLGIALMAATTAGDIIEVVPIAPDIAA